MNAKIKTGLFFSGLMLVGFLVIPFTVSASALETLAKRRGLQGPAAQEYRQLVQATGGHIPVERLVERADVAVASNLDDFPSYLPKTPVGEKAKTMSIEKKIDKEKISLDQVEMDYPSYAKTSEFQGLKSRHEKMEAATKIQAFYRGGKVRRQQREEAERRQREETELQHQQQEYESDGVFATPSSSRPSSPAGSNDSFHSAHSSAPVENELLNTMIEKNSEVLRGLSQQEGTINSDWSGIFKNLHLEDLIAQARSSEVRPLALEKMYVFQQSVKETFDYLNRVYQITYAWDANASKKTDFIKNLNKTLVQGLEKLLKNFGNLVLEKKSSQEVKLIRSVFKEQLIQLSQATIRQDDRLAFKGKNITELIDKIIDELRLGLSANAAQIP